jgi:2-methylisocitrate lyase-like PEP mutase family enzyme
VSGSQARTLLALHQGPRALVLVNVWDVVSARVVEDLGFPALATSSAAIANSLGWEDGEQAPRSAMLDAIQRIVRSVSVPVTADMEAGYASDAEGVGETARLLSVTGAVGMNLEDSAAEGERMADLALQVEKIRAAVEAGRQQGVPLVVNARTDAYWRRGGTPEERFADTVRRAQAYREAGAACIFLPGMRQPAEIERFLRESPGPLNVLAGPGAPTVAELEALGVRRVSLGSSPARAAMGLLRTIAREIRDGGGYDLIARHAIDYAELNRLVRRRPE